MMTQQSEAEFPLVDGVNGNNNYYDFTANDYRNGNQNKKPSQIIDDASESSCFKASANLICGMTRNMPTKR